MAAKPSPSEILAIVDSLTLAEWCGFDTTKPSAPSTSVSSLEAFLTGLGLGPTEHFRILAALSPTDYAAGIAGIRFNGALPTLKERGAMALFHQTARRLCLLDDWPVIAPPALAATPPPPTGGGARALNQPSIQLGRVMDQKTGDEITYLAPAFVTSAYAEYLRVMEVMPSPQVDVTEEQLACMEFMISSNRPPYADFAVWQKYGTRCLRRNSFTGMIGQADGSYRTVEILGPASFEAWAESYEVLCTALIMLDVVRRPRLLAYRAHIQEMSQLHGPPGWALLYQAEVRCRQEWMEHLRIRLAQAHTSALSLGRSTDFRTDKPWDSVWHAAVEDEKFWKREFERPAGKLTNYLAGIEGDAPIQGGGSSSHSARPQPPQQQQLQQPQRGQNMQPNAAGWKTHDTSNPPVELCRGYQTAQCTIGTGSNRCGRNSDLCHRCAICLSAKHGAKRCDAGSGSKQKQQQQQQGNGKNRGATKKKGKKGAW